MADPIAALIEHTNLRPTASAADIERLCAEAATHRFHGVCVHGAHVARAAGVLRGTEQVVVTVVGFPLGACLASVKAYETERAIADGASEVDMVLALGPFLDGAAMLVERDVAAVVAAAGSRPVKVIVETGYLTPAQLTDACHLVQQAGAAFVKTSTGFGPRGASIDDVRTMRAAIGEGLRIKAAGGIRRRADAEAFAAAGAHRLGTSAGVAIVGGET